MSDPPQVNPLLFSASTNVSFDIATSAMLVPPSQDEDNTSTAGDMNSQEADGLPNREKNQDDVKTVSGWFIGDASDADPFSEIGGANFEAPQELSNAATHLLAPETLSSSLQGISPSSSMQCLSSSSSYQRLSPSSSSQTLPPSSSPALPPSSSSPALPPSSSSPALPPSSSPLPPSPPHPPSTCPVLPPSSSPALPPSSSPPLPPSFSPAPPRASPALTPSISPAPPPSVSPMLPSSVPPLPPPTVPPAFTPGFPPPAFSTYSSPAPPLSSTIVPPGVEPIGPQRYQVPPPAPPLSFGQAPLRPPSSMEPPVRPPELTPVSNSGSASGVQPPLAPPLYQGAGHLRRPNAKYVVPPGQGSVRQTTPHFQVPPLPSQNKQQTLPPFSASQLTNQPFIRPPVEAAQPTHPYSIDGLSHIAGYSTSASSGTYSPVPMPSPNSSVTSISSVVPSGSHEEAPAAAIVPASLADPAPSYATVIPSSFENMASKGAPHSMYHPVVPHWFYAEGSPPQWRPFSFTDSLNLEQSYRQGSKELVPTDGDRYDVSISERLRRSVYWDENPTPVRRCSWFRKGQIEARPIPFEEDVSELLENEYRVAMESGTWHKQVELKTGDTIMIHSATSMFYYPLNNLTDFPSGVSVNDASTPMYVKRGMDDFLIEDGEDEQIDHLLFLVHGIGSVCDLRFRAVEECVNDFRKLGYQLLATNFSRVKDQGLVGRVEVLPISWHKALHGDATGIDERLKPITLRSIPKLREFTNDTLLDILFFTSPVYCQHILNTVASEMNRLYNLFCKRNPSFKGFVSLGGHSLGSVILFDLLMNQPTSEEQVDEDENGISPESKENINTLEELLSHLNLEGLSETFQKEQVDLEALKTFTNEELGALDLEKGQLEKLCNFLNKIGGNCSAIEPSTARLRERENSNTSQVDYVVGVAGTGQLSVVYPRICFKPDAFFLLGSPVAMFVTVRGISCLDQSFKLPTCDRVFNIFHPYDPVAYRLETLINPGLTDLRAELIPHHKGRKRMHLEIKETIGRVGSDIKQLVLDTVSSTWNSLYSKLYGGGSQTELEQQVNEAIEQKMGQVEEEDESRHSPATGHPPIGQLNSGRRIDYVLQEKPYETFNEYIFALQAHVSYWESEDTMLMMLKELYRPHGVLCDAEMNEGVESKEPSVQMSPVLSSQYMPVVSGGTQTPPTFNPDLAESTSMSGTSVPLLTPAGAGGCPVPTISLPTSNQSFPLPGSFPNVSNPGAPGNAKVIGGRPVADVTIQPIGMDPTAPPADVASIGPPPSLPVGKFNRKPLRR